MSILFIGYLKGAEHILYLKEENGVVYICGQKQKREVLLSFSDPISDLRYLILANNENAKEVVKEIDADLYRIALFDNQTGGIELEKPTTFDEYRYAQSVANSYYG